VEEIREFVGADSLSFLSVAGVLKGLDLPYEKFCFACFDGRYPVPVPYDTQRHKFVLEDADGEPMSRGETEAIAARRSHE
jgi:amidophosphoribosyltransferase